MGERPTLQPEVPQDPPVQFFRCTPGDCSADSLPMIARSLPGHTILGTSAFVMIALLSLLVLLTNDAVCAVSFLAAMSLIFVIPLFMKSNRKALNRKWYAWTVKHKDQLCLECGQSLHNREETGTCPACTQPYSLESSRWGWRKWRGVEDLPEEPPVRPGPLHERQPCPSILAGCPRMFRLILMFESLALLVALAAFLLFHQLLELSGYTLLIMVVTFLAAIWILVDRPTRAGRKRAAEVDNLLCPECAYRLDDREARGTCPECGFYYTFANCQWAWRRLRKYEHNQPTPPPRLIRPDEQS